MPGYAAVLLQCEGSAGKMKERCKYCNGSGREIDNGRWHICPDCDGTGYVNDDDENMVAAKKTQHRRKKG
jgi:DnaJ-class molecular chaperone